MKKILFICIALLFIVTARAQESGKYYLYAYDKTGEANIYIELTSTDGDMYSATGQTFNSSTDLSGIQVIYGNWETIYAPAADTWPEVKLGTTISLEQGGTGSGWVYGWTLAESNYIYFQLSTLTLAISEDETNPITSSSTSSNAALKALFKSDSWTSPVASYYSSTDATTASSTETLTCVSPGYYLMNIPEGISQIKLTDSDGNSATADYPSGNNFVYDADNSAWDDEAYQAYDASGAETTNADDEAYGLYYTYDVTYNQAAVSGLSYDDTDNSLALTLPSTFAASTYPVVGVASWAFDEASWSTKTHAHTGTIGSVTFPESITYIGAGAFYYCQKMSEVNFAEGLQNISQYAFNGCTSLSWLTFPSTFTTFYSSDAGVFDWCTSLTGVTLQNCTGMTNLGDKTFQNVTWLQTVYLPYTLDEIGDDVFTGSNSSMALYYGITPAKELTTFASCLADYYADFSSVDGLTAYYAEKENDEGTAIVMQPVSDVAAQGDGLVLKATAGQWYQIPLTTTAGTAISGNMLVGNTSNDSFTVSDGMYFLYDGEFCVAASDGTLAKGRAYLDLSSSSAKTFTLSFGDATGISSINPSADKAAIYYNLSGQRVENPQHGLYICNGKKVIM